MCGKAVVVATIGIAVLLTASAARGKLTFEQGSDRATLSVHYGGSFGDTATGTATRFLTTTIQDSPPEIAEEVDYRTDPINFPAQSKQFPVSGSLTDFKTITLNLSVNPVQFTTFTPYFASLQGGVNHVFNAGVYLNLYQPIHFTGTYTVAGPTQQVSGHFDVVPQYQSPFGVGVDTTNFPASVLASDPGPGLAFPDDTPIFSGSVDGVTINLAFDSPSGFLHDPYDPNNPNPTPILLTKSDTPEPSGLVLASPMLLSLLVRRRRQ